MMNELIIKWIEEANFFADLDLWIIKISANPLIVDVIKKGRSHKRIFSICVIDKHIIEVFDNDNTMIVANTGELKTYLNEVFQRLLLDQE